MSDPIRAKSLLNAAQHDLTALTAMLNANSFNDEIFGEHVQQATEKCLKAWLAALGESYPQTYDIDVLLKKIQNLDRDVLAYKNFVAYSSFAEQLQSISIDAEAEPIERENVIVQIQSLHDRVSTILQSIIEAESQAESES